MFVPTQTRFSMRILGTTGQLALASHLGDRVVEAHHLGDRLVGEVASPGRDTESSADSDILPVVGCLRYKRNPRDRAGCPGSLVMRLGTKL